MTLKFLRFGVFSVIQILYNNISISTTDKRSGGETRWVFIRRPPFQKEV